MPQDQNVNSLTPEQELRALCQMLGWELTRVAAPLLHTGLNASFRIDTPRNIVIPDDSSYTNPATIFYYTSATSALNAIQAFQSTTKPC